MKPVGIQPGNGRRTGGLLPGGGGLLAKRAGNALAASTFPPVPDINNFTAIFSLYAVNETWQGGGVDLMTVNSDFVATTTPPYIADYPAYAPNAGSDEAEQEVFEWYNQAGSWVSGVLTFEAPRPHLRIATPFDVTGAGTASNDGRYEYDGIVSGRSSYEKSGGGRIEFDSGDAQFEMPDTADPDYVGGTEFYPTAAWSQAGGQAPAPTVAMSTAYADQAAWVDTASQMDANLTLAESDVDACTVFVKFRTREGSAEQVILMTDDYGISGTGFTISLDGNDRCFAEIKNVLLSNSKRFTLDTDTWYLVSVVFDCTQLNYEDQVKMWVNGSTGPVEQRFTKDLFGCVLESTVRVGSNSGANPLIGDLTEVWVAPTALSDEVRQQTEARIAAQYPVVALG